MNIYLFQAKDDFMHMGLFGFLCGLEYCRKDRVEIISKDCYTLEIVAKMHQLDVDHITSKMDVTVKKLS